MAAAVFAGLVIATTASANIADIARALFQRPTAQKTLPMADARLAATIATTTPMEISLGTTMSHVAKAAALMAHKIAQMS